MTMMRNIKIKGLLASAIAFIALTGNTNAATTEGLKTPERNEYTSVGIFGKWDYPSIQRGLQVYIEVCSACHSLDLVAFRTLQDVGFSEDEVKALALEYEYEDVVDEFGDPIFRTGIPADYFPSPYQNDEQARAGNNGALPPDFSTIVKEREHLSFLPWKSTYGED